LSTTGIRIIVGGPHKDPGDEPATS
jgi:hypothetical protein